MTRIAKLIPLLLPLAACATPSPRIAELTVDLGDTGTPLQALRVSDLALLRDTGHDVADVVIDGRSDGDACRLAGTRRNLLLVGTGSAAQFAALANHRDAWHLDGLGEAAGAAAIAVDDDFAAYWPTTDVMATAGMVLAVRTPQIARAGEADVAAWLRIAQVDRHRITLSVARNTSSPRQSAPPDGEYLKVYAMQMVEQLRRADIDAGAFEIDDEPAADGRYRLRIDVHDDGRTDRLVIELAPRAGGLDYRGASLGDAPAPTGAGSRWHQLPRLHHLADQSARADS